MNIPMRLTWNNLRQRFSNKQKGNSIQLIAEGNKILKEIVDSEVMHRLWKSYQKKFSYAEDISWEMVMDSIEKLFAEVV